MIDKFFFKYNTYSSFKEDKTTGQIPEDAICFIKDKKIIYTRGIEFSTQIELVEWSGKIIDSAEIQSTSTLNKESKYIVFIKSVGCFAYDLNGNGSSYINNWGNIDLFQTNVYVNGNIPSLKNNFFIDLNKKIWIVTGNNNIQELPSIGQTDLNNSTGEIFNDYENNIASGNYSHAEGYNTNAIGNYGSHAEGYQTQAGDSSSDYSPHAEGYQTKATGDYGAHSEGKGTIASGNSSHAEGSSTTASGQYSHAEGQGVSASGVATHAEGYYTQTYQQGEHAEGTYNKSYNSTTTSTRVIHSVGIGSSTSNRKNAHEIKYNGDHYVYGIGGFDGTNYSSAKTLQEVINPSVSTVKTVNGVTVNSTSQSYSFTSSDANYDIIRMFVNYSNGGCAYLNIQNVFLNGFKSIIDSKEGYAKIKLMIKNNGTAYIALRLNGSKFVNSNGEKWGRTCVNTISYSGIDYSVGTNIPDLGGTTGAAEFGGYGIIDIEGMWWNNNLYLITILFDRLGTSVQ